MLYLIAFLAPPLALLLSGKPIQAIISGIFWVVSWFTFVFFGAGFVLWAILAIHAFMVVRDRAQRKMMEDIVHLDKK